MKPPKPRKRTTSAQDMRTYKRLVSAGVTIVVLVILLAILVSKGVIKL